MELTSNGQGGLVKEVTGAAVVQHMLSDTNWMPPPQIPAPQIATAPQEEVPTVSGQIRSRSSSGVMEQSTSCPHIDVPPGAAKQMPSTTSRFMTQGTTGTLLSAAAMPSNSFRDMHP